MLVCSSVVYRMETFLRHREIHDIRDGVSMSVGVELHSRMQKCKYLDACRYTLPNDQIKTNTGEGAVMGRR